MPIRDLPCLAVAWVLAAGILGLSCGAAAQSCSVSATAAAFGQYSPAAAVPNDTTASISMSCQSAAPKLVTYTLALSAGLGGSYAARSLRSGANALGYQIFSNPLRSTVWGDGTGSTGTVNGSLASASVPVSASATAYARIPARQNVGPGLYADSILVIVTY